MKIDAEKIGTVIGPGGKMIRHIGEESGADVNIDDDGTVTIYGKTKAQSDKAEEMIRQLTEDPEVGRIYNGTVKRIVDFGAFVEILPGKEGLVHISKLARNRVESVRDVLKEEQEIPVKLLEIDRMGRLNLSYIDAIDSEGGGGRGRDDNRGHGKDQSRRRH
jgi:polyribonucleotide nucleotidyltransferase